MNRKNFHTQLTIRVFNLGNKGATKRRITPKPGHHWNDKGVDEVLDHLAEDLEKRFPAEEFRLVQVGPGAYNFIHAGKRELEPERINFELKGTVNGKGIQELAEDTVRGMVDEVNQQYKELEGGS